MLTPLNFISGLVCHSSFTSSLDYPRIIAVSIVHRTCDKYGMYVFGNVRGSGNVAVMVMLGVVHDEVLVEFYSKRRIMAISSFREQMSEDIREPSCLVLGIWMWLVRFQDQDLDGVFVHPAEVFVGFESNDRSLSWLNKCIFHKVQRLFTSSFHGHARMPTVFVLSWMRHFAKAYGT